MSSTPEVSDESKSEVGSVSDVSEVSSIADPSEEGDDISSVVESETSVPSSPTSPSSVASDDIDNESKNVQPSIAQELPPSEVIAAVVSDEEAADDTDTDDEDIYQKLEGDINSTLLIQNHPGITQSSYPEILTLTKVIRNDKGEIIDDLHKTYPFVTKYERAKIIGVRTKQLNHGADPFVDVPPDMIDGYSIALKELEEKKLPYIIARPLPNGGSEYWRLSDLELIHY